MATLTPPKHYFDALTDILAAVDPKPSDPWMWTAATHTESNKQEGVLESIGQVHDLVSGLWDNWYLIIEHGSDPGMFTQCYRDGDRFRTECNLREVESATRRVYTIADKDGYLSMANCRAIMATYIEKRGELPALEGYVPEIVNY